MRPRPATELRVWLVQWSHSPAPQQEETLRGAEESSRRSHPSERNGAATTLVIALQCCAGGTHPAEASALSPGRMNFATPTVKPRIPGSHQADVRLLRAMVQALLVASLSQRLAWK